MLTGNLSAPSKILTSPLSPLTVASKLILPSSLKTVFPKRLPLPPLYSVSRTLAELVEFIYVLISKAFGLSFKLSLLSLKLKSSALRPESKRVVKERSLYSSFENTN